MPVGAAVGGAAASIGGGILGAKAQKKAAKKAVEAQKDVTATNNALVREQYGQNAARLDPYSNNGLRASNVLTDILLGPQSSGAGMGSSVSLADAQDQWATSALGALGSEVKGDIWSQVNSISDPSDKLAALRPLLKARDNQVLNGFTSGNPMPTVGQTLPGGHVITDGTTPAPTTGGTGAQSPSALSAWDQFRNGTNYQWRLNEGEKAVNQGYAANGALESGAAQIALQERGQQFASNELSNWMNMLAGQQNTGLSASSALAGVGQNMVTNVSNNNQNAADAISNGALANGTANQNMWGSIGSGIGQIAGAFGSSYKPSGSNGFSYGGTTFNPGW